MMSIGPYLQTKPLIASIRSVRFHADLTDDGRWCAACQANGRRKYICGKTQSEVLAKRQMAAQIEKRLCTRRKRKPNPRTERFTHILALFLVIFKESILLAVPQFFERASFFAYLLQNGRNGLSANWRKWMPLMINRFDRICGQSNCMKQL